MKKIIEKYKKFIFIYVIINLFALLVNVFGIGLFTTTRGLPVDWAYILTNTDKNDQYRLQKNSYEDVWPFINFIEHVNTFNDTGYHEDITIGFNGIFYQYDISEFLLYIGVLIAFLIYKAYILEPEKVIVKKNKV